MNKPDSDLVTEFHPSNFADNSNQVDNTYLPLIPGTQFIYQGVANRGGGLSDHKVIFTVTDLVRTINGVNTVVVWDRDIILLSHEAAHLEAGRGHRKRLAVQHMRPGDVLRR